jgi:hypothetical protein
MGDERRGVRYVRRYDRSDDRGPPLPDGEF